jgi:signal transduction histidine kinase/DNA-binding response OmpR family regulator/serine phosphatase RsbU (regulator of sigma subunit)
VTTVGDLLTPGSDPFQGGGAVGADLAAVDWSATPLGPPADWPQSLKSAVRIVLSSRFSMWMCWGPELTFFCNDAYRRDTLGAKYPWALGKPTSVVWKEIWSDVGPRLASVMATGEATWDEALLLFLERSGYPEETYHTFSYSPLTDDEDQVVGMLCVVSEDTEAVVGARRMTTLRDIGAALSSVQTEADVLAVACEQLARDQRSLPFTLIYSFDETGTAQLVGSSGMPAGHPAAPGCLGHDDDRWPVGQVAAGAVAVVDDLADRFPDLPTGAWGHPPVKALVVPLRLQADGPPFGFLVAGLNRHRPLDDAYVGFVNLVAGQLAAGIAGARAYDAERHRAERLAELDLAKTAFFTNVSHEFRTPLTLLLGPAEDALTDVTHPLPGAQRERVEVINRNAQRLLKLVNALLDFSRLEAGSAHGSYEPVDLAAYTADLAQAFSVATSRVGLSLTVGCPPLGQPVWVDQDMWAKVVLNLLSNALKFTFEGGITLRLREHEGWAELTVTDTGTGIEATQQERLFERFHQVPGAAARTHEGSGIGLALVAELTALHGGSVDVASEPGHGSTFTVRVPLGNHHLPAEQVVHRPVERLLHVERKADGFLAEALRWLGDGAPPSAPPVRGERARVLVVDDNADMRGYVSTLLSELYDVDTAANGRQGLEKARLEPPDLVLTDVMMPELDGFQLLAKLRADAATSHVPVIMLSARAGEEATVEGLDAGADDYLVKPFAARELLARVRSNLELDRVRRTRTQLERSRSLLDQAQRLAQVSSWEIDLVSGGVSGTEEFFRQIGLPGQELPLLDLAGVIGALVHPDDVERVEAALTAGLAGSPIDYEVRLRRDDGDVRSYRTIGEVVRAEDGTPLVLRGSNQDITQQREAERAMAAAAASQEAAAREHRIADELQASLLPPRTFDPDHLQIATYYRAGVEGTQVGGDWYDVIELGAGRTALVMGDVMGRGVRAAAVMGQLRSAVRAYARLDLPPADVLENLDSAVRELGSDQIVTCVYAVYDPGERTLVYASAGHLPPLLVVPGQPARRLTGAASPPLGVGQPGMVEERVELPADALLVLYTDGLVERRDSDLDAGIDALAQELDAWSGSLEDLPMRLVQSLLPDGPDDDIAVLLAQVDQSAAQESSVSIAITGDLSKLRPTRQEVARRLREWGAEPDLVDDVVLLVSELVTNAVVHGRPPVELRVRRSRAHLVLEVEDHASYLPRRMRPTEHDEHGRGLQLVALLADRWGTRPTHDGKVVWCVFSDGVNRSGGEGV